jgi:hypothetical protein
MNRNTELTEFELNRRETRTNPHKKKTDDLVSHCIVGSAIHAKSAL